MCVFLSAYRSVDEDSSIAVGRRCSSSEDERIYREYQWFWGLAVAAGLAALRSASIDYFRETGSDRGWRIIPVAAIAVPMCLIAELLPIRSYRVRTGWHPTRSTTSSPIPAGSFGFAHRKDSPDSTATAWSASVPVGSHTVRSMPCWKRVPAHTSSARAAVLTNFIRARRQRFRGLPAGRRSLRQTDQHAAGISVRPDMVRNDCRTLRNAG
jgi:hypothetical protein